MKKSSNTPDYQLIERSPDMPAGADFALSLSDDCMEPYFLKGEAVYVQAMAELDEFEAGVFMYEGRVICRQWCQDFRGDVYLLCANPRRESENIVVEKHRQGELRCLGKVLSDKKLPPPFYR